MLSEISVSRGGNGNGCSRGSFILLRAHLGARILKHDFYEAHISSLREHRLAVIVAVLFTVNGPLGSRNAGKLT